jgi:glycosyltransferase involved in cell wall biosynthesis
MENSPVKVCMISCLHGLYDDRIYWKEALSLKKNGYDVTHIGVGKKDQHFISEHGIQLIEIKKKRYFENPFIDKLFRTITFKPSVYKSLLQKASELQADVYHFHDYQLNRIGPKLKLLPHLPKVIYDVHEPYPEIARYLNTSKGFAKIFHILFSIYIDHLQKKCSTKYDLVITTEENVAIYFQKFLKKNKVQIIYNYCDFDLMEFKENDKKIYDLIYIGGISSWRGIYELLETAILIRNSKLNLKILFLGNVKERGLKKRIEQFIDNEKLGSIFILKDSVSRKEVVRYLSLSRIGICIFRNNPVYHIILPIKVFEYFSAGLPIIGNNFGHTYHILMKEKAGIAIDEISAKNILDSTVYLLNSKTYYNELSINAKNSLANYSWKIMEIKLLELYSELCSEN